MRDSMARTKTRHSNGWTTESAGARVLKAAMPLVGLYGLGRWLASKRRMNFSGRRVLVTGGSRGLGLILAAEFARRGARVTICARDEAELRRAKASVRQWTAADIETIPCDVTQDAQVARLASAFERRDEAPDVVANVAGVIQVGPLEIMSMQDFHNAMNVNFWGAVNVIMAFLPMLVKKRNGRILNVTSIGGVVPVPHLMPYTCSKFAMVGWSQGLGVELRKYGILVTTVVPGLMRTGSFVNAMFKGRSSEYGWFSLGATAPVISLNAIRAAQRMIEALARGKAFAVIGAPARILRAVFLVAPGAMTNVMAFANRWIMPAPPRSGSFWGRGAPERAVPGRQFQHHEKSVLGRVAAAFPTARYNE